MKVFDGVVLGTIKISYYTTWFVARQQRFYDDAYIFGAYKYEESGEIVCLVAGVDFDVAQTAVDLDMVGLYDTSRG